MKPWLVAGAGLGLAAALALGVTVQSRLTAEEPDRSPPPLAPVASLTTSAPSLRPGGTSADPTDAAPAYMLGKDWRRLALAAPGPSSPIGPDPQTYYLSPLGRPQAMAADAASAAVEAAAIASADGGPPITVPIVDNEATPEAAGDTRLDR